MARSMRTIRRYLVDLVRFGYIELETRTNARGLHLGLVVASPIWWRRSMRRREDLLNG